MHETLQIFRVKFPWGFRIVSHPVIDGVWVCEKNEEDACIKVEDILQRSGDLITTLDLWGSGNGAMFTLEESQSPFVIHGLSDAQQTLFRERFHHMKIM